MWTLTLTPPQKAVQFWKKNEALTFCQRDTEINKDKQDTNINT